MSLVVIRGITNAGKTSALIAAVDRAREQGRTVRLCLPDVVQTRAEGALADDRILSARDSTSTPIDVFATAVETLELLSRDWPEDSMFAFEEAQYYGGQLDEIWRSLSEAGHEVLVSTVTDEQAHALHRLGAQFRTLNIDCSLLADAPATRFFIVPNTGASIPVCDRCWNDLRLRAPSVLRDRLIAGEPAPGTTQIYQPPGVDLAELADLSAIREDSSKRLAIMRTTMLDHLGGSVSGKSYLDIGCNTGFFCRSLAADGMNAHGVDVVKDDIITARLMDTYFTQRPSTWTVADGVDFIERQSGSFDVISTFSVFQWIYIQHKNEAKVSAALEKLFNISRSLVFFEMGYVTEDHYKDVLLEDIDRDWVFKKMKGSGAFSSIDIIEEGVDGLKRDFFIGIRKQAKPTVRKKAGPRAKLEER